MVMGSTFDFDAWKPRTALGKKVKNREITDLGEILDQGYRILEPEIIDTLLPDLQTELIEVGQSKGKFGGGKGSIWKQTQKKTSEGNRIKFSAFAAVGNKNGYVGVGFGSSKETVPAREKAIRKAKLNIIKIRRGCGSWEDGSEGSHSIPFKVSGKEGSINVTFMPAPRGTGLKAEKKIRAMLKLAGIEDIYTKTKGKTSTKLNFFKAAFNALKELSRVKVLDSHKEKTTVIEGVKES